MSEKQSVIQLVVVGTAMLLLVGGFVISFLFFYSRKQHKYRQEKLAMETAFKEEMLRTQLEIQEQTLKNISQEIHDNIGQTLSLVKLYLNVIDFEKQNGAHEKIQTSKELVGKAIQDLRSLSKTMNTDAILSAGLIKAIEFELQLMDKAFKTELQVTGHVIKLDPQKELILFRITQEALNNIIKHASATTVRIRVDFTEKDFKLAIDDDGVGFEKPAGSSGMEAGSGLHNMRTRAQIIGGQLHMESKASSGTKILITLPINES